jgi:cytidylate kinase
MTDLRKSDSYVLSGSVCGWGHELETSFDFVIFLLTPTEIRVQRLVERETRKLGYVDRKFIEWAQQYDEGTSACGVEHYMRSGSHNFVVRFSD